MREPEGLAFLRSFPDFELGNVTPGTAFTLDRVLALLEEVGSPHLLLPVIHLAGTKGKGSTAAMVASVTRAAGYRTGLFTQPHLLTIHERFQMDGVSIDDPALSAVMIDMVRPAVERLRLRGISGVQQFEAQVALAFLWFKEQGAEVVVLETGLGGRLDGTNVVPAPLCTTLTPIGYDHVAVLGYTLEEIAGEKAAIIKDRVPVVSAPQTPEVTRVFEAVARTHMAPMAFYDREWRVRIEDVSLIGTRFSLEVDWEGLLKRGPLVPPIWPAADRQGLLRGLGTALLGAHQAINAGTAAMTIVAASPRLERLDVAALRQGLAAVSWPGRLQVVGQAPTVVLDGAHTGESALVLADAMGALFPDRQVVLVCGMQADKDIPATVAPLAAIAAAAIATQAAHPRAARPEAVAAALRAAGCRKVEERDDPLAALERARQVAGAAGVVLVTGSLYLVSAVLRSLGERPA
ncbi:MAG TPA: folylpolyglutamate synthase/dihydrofolate synthase family protein [Chloroflexota bacterium]|nr:folylpolyglutamate synthase/dihydrofolate synthase family protein [Chloroflexota bacterium]